MISNIIARFRLIREFAKLRTLLGSKNNLAWYIFAWKELDKLVKLGELRQGK
jgi:hypothetical protein